ncbi:MAG: hypothetical protein CM15mV86_330 [uncultured marine virus]|nr:MAG: hypothetical protein CM15mV86_330 [uncultured marine virus]
MGKASRTIGNILLGTKEWTAKNVGARAARLIEDSEIMVRHELNEIDNIYNDTFAGAAKVFDDNPALKKMLLQINRSLDDKAVSWDQATAVARTAEEKQAVQLMRDQVKVLQDLDIVKFPDGDYMPTIVTGKDKKSFGVNDYANPVEALKQYAKDVAMARAVAKRFDIDLNKLDIKEDLGSPKVESTLFLKKIDDAAKRARQGRQC